MLCYHLLDSLSRKVRIHDKYVEGTCHNKTQIWIIEVWKLTNNNSNNEDIAQLQ